MGYKCGNLQLTVEVWPDINNHHCCNFTSGTGTYIFVRWIIAGTSFNMSQVPRCLLLLCMFYFYFNSVLLSYSLYIRMYLLWWNNNLIADKLLFIQRAIFKEHFRHKNVTVLRIYVCKKKNDLYFDYVCKNQTQKN